MRNHEKPHPTRAAAGAVKRRAFDLIFDEIETGLCHGFFDLSVSCQIVNGKKRQLVVKAGKSHQFLIPANAIED